MDRLKKRRPFAAGAVSAGAGATGAAQYAETGAVPGIVRGAALAVMLGVAFGTVWGAQPVCAAEPDLDLTGSIDVAIHAYASDEPVSGGTLELYRIADVSFSEAEGYAYVYTPDFAGCDGALLTEEGLGLADTAEAFAERVREADVPAEMSAALDAHGKASFEDLPCGLYLIMQGMAANGYRAINPFLVTVPAFENGIWVYRVDATPKTSPVSKEEPEDETPPDEGTPPEPGTPSPGTGNTPGTTTGDTPGSTAGTTGRVRTGDRLPAVGGTIAAGAAAAVIVASLIIRRKRRA